MKKESNSQKKKQTTNHIRYRQRTDLGVSFKWHS